MRSLVLLLLVPSVALANPKYTRKPELHIDVKTSVRTKPLPVTADSHVPTASADQIFAAEIAKEPIRAEQEVLLLELVRDTPDDDAQKPDYLFRLAEMYAKELSVWRLRATELQLTTP